LTEVTDEFGFELSNRMVSAPPPQDQPATVNDTVLNTTVTIAAQVTVSVVGSSAVAAGVSVGGGSAAMALLSQMQYFSYIGTANYSMTGTMNNFYTNLNQKSTFPNFFKRDINNGQAVAGRRLDSAQDLIEVYDFLDSAGQYLTLIALIMVVHALVHLLSRYLGQKWHCLKRLEGSFLWGVYIYFWYFAFLDVQVSALLQLRVLHIIAEIDSLIVFILLCVATLEYDTPKVDICWVIFAFTAKSFLCTCLIVIVSMVIACKEACERRKNRNKVVNYTAESLSIEAPKPNVITTTDPDLSFGHEADWAQKPFDYIRQAKRNTGELKIRRDQSSN
jgi:hypothetical protein